MTEFFKEPFLPDEKEDEPKFITDFAELESLASFNSSDEEGPEITFQPYRRYQGKRQVGTMRRWKENPGVVIIDFMGSQGEGITMPDTERVTAEDFELRKDEMKITLKE